MITSTVEKLDANPAIDRAALLSRFEGDVELFREVAQLFIEDCPRRLSEMDLALACGDCQKVADIAHSLRGSMSNFNAEAAVSAARRVEQLARDGDIGDARGPCASLEIEIHRLRRALAALL